MFLPLQPEERFNEFVNMGDIHLLPQRLDAVDLVMPSKLGAILAAGKPVIAMVPRDSQIALTLSDAGVVVPPEDAAALARAIHGLASDLAGRQTMGGAALAIAGATFDADDILGRVEARLLAAVEESKRKRAAARERV
jgi:colanic acid biosynthesis glycosyl transferase WcaI